MGFSREGCVDSPMLTPMKNVICSWSKRRHALASVLLCVLVVFAACGTDSNNGSSNDEDRRFVTEKNPTRAATETPETRVEATSVPPTAVPTVAPEQLLVPRGAPNVIYLTIDGVLNAYDAHGRSFTPVEIPEGVTALDFTSSPTGDRVGVLLWNGDDVTVQFFGADGLPLGDATALNVVFVPTSAASPSASPVASPVATGTPALHIDWIPQGNGVLVSGPGVLQRVSMNGTIMPVSRTGATGTVTNAVWSPMDSQVVIQTQQMDGHQAIFLLNSGQDESTEISSLHDSFGPSITNLQWLPTGLGLVFVAGSVDNGTVMNGQLYTYRFGEDVPKLVATSGQGGPTATITHAVISPDGQSVAYVIMVRDLDQWHLHSLWVKPLRGGSAVSIPTATNSPITALYWSGEGLVWQQEDGSTSVVDGSMQPRPLGEEPVATPVASPIASPVATPVDLGTPRG